MTVEDVILRGDRRGMARLRPLLPADFCTRAARGLLDAIHDAAAPAVLIVTGFLVGGLPETDGPPGALALHRALARLGARPVLVSDGLNADVLARRLDVPVVSVGSIARGARPEVVSFPVTDTASTRSLARLLLDVLCPAALVSIERCGPGADGVHRNSRGRDISAVTARLEVLFETSLLGSLPRRPLTIGVGDGGNEIGMGSLARACLDEGVTSWPSTCEVDLPVIAAVSNWGAWGLVAAMSRESMGGLLPLEEEFAEDLRELVALQCVDGFAAVPQPTVDGFDLDANLEILRSLREFAKSPRPPGDR